MNPHGDLLRLQYPVRVTAVPSIYKVRFFGIHFKLKALFLGSYCETFVEKQTKLFRQ